MIQEKKLTRKLKHNTMNTITRSTPVKDLPALLSVKEAASYLGLNDNSLYIKIRRGEFQEFTIRLGRSLYIRREIFEGEQAVIVQQF